MPQAQSPQKRATVVATITATLLTIAKLTVGVMSGSVAILASAIDSLLDMSISVFNYFAIQKSEENPNAEYQYGKGKIQAIAGVIEGTVITVSGLFIIYQAFKKLIRDEKVEMLTPSIIVMLLSLIVTYFLVKYLLRIALQTDNIVIKADALHYQTDLYSNAAVLLALVLVSMTGYSAIDAIFGFAIGIYIIYSAYEIIAEGIAILLDRALDGDTVAHIGEIISSHTGVNSYHWLKTRTDGSINFVEFHLVLHPDMKLHEAHDISDEIEDEIKALDDKKKWLITPHYDPYDDEHINEKSINS